MPAQNHAPNWWHPVWEFVIHVLIGSVLFAIIATPAIGLDFGMQWLETKEVSWGVIYILAGVKYAVLLLDCGLYLYFLWKMGKVFRRSISSFSDAPVKEHSHA